MNSFLEYYNRNIDKITNKFEQCECDITDEIWRYSNDYIEEVINKYSICLAIILADFNKSFNNRIHKIKTFINEHNIINILNELIHNQQHGNEYNDNNNITYNSNRFTNDKTITDYIVNNTININEVINKSSFCLDHYFGMLATSLPVSSMLSILTNDDEQINECFNWLDNNEYLYMITHTRKPIKVKIIETLKRIRKLLTR